MAVCGARALVKATARIHTAERDRFPAGSCRLRPFSRKMEESCRERRQRQQIATIVLEHRHERTRIARADELKITSGDLEARHIARAADAQHFAFERDQ